MTLSNLVDDRKWCVFLTGSSVLYEILEMAVKCVCSIPPPAKTRHVVPSRYWNGMRFLWWLIC